MPRRTFRSRSTSRRVSSDSAPSGEAPQEGRQQTRINWLLKQLKDDSVPADLVVKVDWDRKGLRTLGKAGELRVNASGLMFDGHHQPVPADAMPRRFLLEHTCKLDKPKGKSTTSVLKGISDDLEAFYRNVVEHLAGYVAPAPKLPKEHVASVAEGAVSVEAPAIAALLSELPSSGMPARVQHGDDHNDVVISSVEHAVGKPL
jgi:hypothetical protein